MARISDRFSSEWMKASDVEKGFRSTIYEVTEEEIGQGPAQKKKLVLWFKNHEKGLVLNKTNGTILAEIYGDETDNWPGKRIVLKSQKVEYQGKRVDGIRVDEAATREAAQGAPVVPTKKPAPPMTQQEVDSGNDIPW